MHQCFVIALLCDACKQRPSIRASVNGLNTDRSLDSAFRDDSIEEERDTDIMITDTLADLPMTKVQI